MKQLAIVAAFLAAGGCKKSETKQEPPAAPAAGAAEQKPTEPAAAFDGPAPFAAWDMAARRAAWNGAWVGDYSSLGQTAAWEVGADNKITLVDKKGEQTLELEVESPCTAKFVEKSEGGSSSTTKAYTLKDGQLITGLGSAGSRKGDNAIVCAGGAIYVLEGTTCTDWRNNFRRWESKPAECGIKKSDTGDDVFWFTQGGSEQTLPIQGDAVLSEQLAKTHAMKHPDFAAAKAAAKL